MIICHNVKCDKKAKVFIKFTKYTQKPLEISLQICYNLFTERGETDAAFINGNRV